MVGALGSLVAQSRLFQTPAFPAGSGPDFVNGAIVVQTALAAPEVLAQLHRIESDFGRVRESRWGPRVIDLDLIAYDDLVLPDLAGQKAWMDLPLDQQLTQAPTDLILPHPRMQDRSFVLGPLADVAPDWVHPVLGLSVVEMLAARPVSERAEVVPLEG